MHGIWPQSRFQRETFSVIIYNNKHNVCNLRTAAPFRAPTTVPPLLGPHFGLLPSLRKNVHMHTVQVRWGSLNAFCGFRRCRLRWWEVKTHEQVAIKNAVVYLGGNVWRSGVTVVVPLPSHDSCSTLSSSSSPDTDTLFAWNLHSIGQ